MNKRLVVAVLALLLLGLGTTAAVAAPRNDKGSPARGGTCENTIDDDGDDDVDASDDDCRKPGCRQSGQTPKKCEEGGAKPPPPRAERCTEAGGDAGLAGDPVGQQAWDAGLKASPATENPEGNGEVSGRIISGGNGTPVEPLTNEGGCAVDLFVDESVAPADA